MHYREHPLNIDIDRLGKCYFDIKSKLSFKTDDDETVEIRGAEGLNYKIEEV